MPSAATAPVGTPPAPTSAAPPAPVSVAVVTAAIAPDPPKARGKNALTLTVTGLDGKPLTGATVTASVAMTTMDMGTSRPVFQDMGGGRYQGSIIFSMPGPWRVSVVVAFPAGGEQKRYEYDYRVTR